MSISDLALSALWFGAGAAAAWKLTALHYRSRLSEATASEARYRAWWIRDSGEMLIAKAQLDLIHEQHVAAGRKAHEPWKALRRETTEKLMKCVAERQLNTLPAADPEPASGIPADHSAGRIAGGRGRETPRHTGQDNGRGHPLHVTPRASTGNEPGRSCRRNRAGHFASAETSHGHSKASS
jgi:hypothetical protein